MQESYKQKGGPEKVIVKNRGEATSKILETFRRAQKENYSALDFHNEKHPEMVRGAALEFAKIIKQEDPTLVTKDTLGDIANSAASHDSVLNVAHGERITRFRGFFDTDIPENTRIMMAKADIQQGNERLSAEWLNAELDRYVGEDGRSVFDAKSKTEMIDAIAATLPDYDFAATISDQDFERYFSDERMREAGLEQYRTGIKIWQPHLKAESSITALAIATGDLRGEVGSKQYEDYRRSGNSEFREIHEGLRSAVAQNSETMSLEKKINAAEDMLKWVKTQITFAMWQKMLFWKSVEENALITGSLKATEIKKALHERYDNAFDTNILKAKERYERLADKYEEGEQRKERLAKISDADFQELLSELGFSEATSKK